MTRKYLCSVARNKYKLQVPRSTGVFFFPLFPFFSPFFLRFSSVFLPFFFPFFLPFSPFFLPFFSLFSSLFYSLFLLTSDLSASGPRAPSRIPGPAARSKGCGTPLSACRPRSPRPAPAAEHPSGRPSTRSSRRIIDHLGGCRVSVSGRVTYGE